MNLANKLTLSRIFLVPIFMLFIMPIPIWMMNSNYLIYIRPELIHINNFIELYGNKIAAIFFIIAASTDGVDGYIARKRKQVTTFGKFLDPIADKLLVTAALIALVYRRDITGWSAMIIIGREFIITGLRLVAAGEGKIITASIWGKIKTILQMIAISAALLNNFPLNLITDFDFATYTMMLAVIVTLYSGYDYIKKNYKVIDYKN